MAGFKMQLTGVNAALGELNLKGLEKQVQGELDKFALNVVQDAKQLVPIDESHLSQSIGFVKRDLEVEIVVNSNYAAYVEFGTRKFAAQYVSTLPTEFQAFARQFKGGGGGSFDELVMRIFEWVKRKGIRLEPKQTSQGDSYRSGRLVNTSRKRKRTTIVEGQQQLAYAIAVKIVREGIKPQPFLYPAYEKNRILLLEELRKIINA
jgi:hypothetical protein